MARLMVELYEELGLQVQWQQVEDGRANALGTWRGTGGGKSLMFNGHMDTSYSGREPWLRDVPGFQPKAFVRDGRLYGLGISNMKGALACYVEAVRALQDAGVRLRGDVLVAAVCGEIEKTQYRDAQGAEFRGYAAGTRYLVSHGGVADMCLLGEPTEGKVVLGHFGALWLRIRVHGNFIHTAFSEGKRDQNSILRAREVLDAVLDWIPTWEDDPSNAYRGAKAIVNVGAIEGGFGWRVSRTPHHTDLFLDVRVPPTKPMAVARREVLDMVRGLAERFPDYGVEGEVYVTAPGAEIDEGHELVAAIDAAHDEVFGEPPGRDVTRWFSDASALTRYGVADRQLRHLDRADGRRARREPRDRRARQDRRSVYARVRDGRVCGSGAGMKLVTYDDRQGRRTSSTARRSSGSTCRRCASGSSAAARDETGERDALAEAKLRAPIVPKKFFHTAGNFREHEEESKNVNWTHRIAPWINFFQNVDAIVGPDEPIDLSRAPDRGARLRARARRRPQEGRQVVLAGGGGRLHRRLRDLQRHHRARHPAAARCARASSASARRSTRSARSGRGS